ncbi:unnamed protein product [Ixodes persulcatus]
MFTSSMSTTVVENSRRKGCGGSFCVPASGVSFPPTTLFRRQACTRGQGTKKRWRLPVGDGTTEKPPHCRRRLRLGTTARLDVVVWPPERTGNARRRCASSRTRPPSTCTIVLTPRGRKSEKPGGWAQTKQTENVPAACTCSKVPSVGSRIWPPEV